MRSRQQLAVPQDPQGGHRRVSGTSLLSLSLVTKGHWQGQQAPEKPGDGQGTEQTGPRLWRGKGTWLSAHPCRKEQEDQAPGGGCEYVTGPEGHGSGKGEEDRAEGGPLQDKAPLQDRVSLQDEVVASAAEGRVCGAGASSHRKPEGPQGRGMQPLSPPPQRTASYPVPSPSPRCLAP